MRPGIGLGGRVREWSASVLAYGAHRDGRVIVLGAVAGYLAAVAGFRVIAGVDVWPWLGVPSGPSLFFDARNVTAAVECHRLGHDPLVSNPCDPQGRAMFYPRAWLLLGQLGLDQSHTDVFGVVVGVAFVVTLCLLVGRLSGGEGVVVALAACSPAVMFAVERANMDLLLFSVLALAVLAWRRGGSVGTVAAPALVLLAGVGKLYPAAALPAFAFTRDRRAALTAGACLVAFVGYLAATAGDVLQIGRTAVQGEYFSYGARILLARAYHLLLPGASQAAAVVAQAVALLPLVVLAAGGWLWARRRLAPGGAGAAGGWRLVSFHLGALVYVGTFAVGNSFDYRLVFLLLTLPQLFAWARGRREGDDLGAVAGLGLAAVLLALWVGSLSQYVALADELVSWGLAAVLIVLSAASVPDFAVLRRSLSGGGTATTAGEPVRSRRVRQR